MMDAHFPTLTVIVPVYNSARYLDEALLSLRRALPPSSEVVVVNDGSTDGSAALCRRFAAAWPNAVLLERENGGYGAACNTGIARANGDYVAIFEPDDVLEPPFYSRLLERAAATNADVIRYNGYRTFDAEGNVSHVERPISREMAGRSLGKFSLPWLWLTHPCVWNGLYSRRLFAEKRVRFAEGAGASFQDQQFLTALFYTIDSLVVVNGAEYRYRRHDGQSVAHADAKVDAVIANWQSMADWLTENGYGNRDYFLLNTFRQFRALYLFRLRKEESRSRLHAAILDLRRREGIRKLTYPGASIKMRMLYRFLSIYPELVAFSRWWDTHRPRMKFFFGHSHSGRPV